uniref:pectinesterase n=1 Tax=Oryza sativa subsp. japonica TaxID=39947 RepID=Q109P9_ORYSJ|nr:Pectinesterase family protein, expressed [Oryza sativa Japonica Group]
MAQQQPRRVLRVAPPGRGGARAEAERGEEGEAVFATVQAAVDAVPVGNRVRTVIRLAPGTYREPVYVAKAKNLVTLSGEAGSPEATVITWDNTATRIKHSQSSRVIGTGTFGCGTIIVEGEDFIAENITFENSAPQGSGQAVALRVTADRCAFYNCRFLGWQVTVTSSSATLLPCWNIAIFIANQRVTLLLTAGNPHQKLLVMCS